MSASIFELIYQQVRQIPEGKVATYGQIARLVGLPRNARQVGYALSSLKGDHDVPWHRVVNARGEVSTRAHTDYEQFQRILLEEEGIEIGIQGRIRLKQYQWDC